MQKPAIQNATDFFIAYTTALLSAGTYTARIVKCVRRIAEVYGYEIHINFFFHNISVNIFDKDDHSIQRTYIIPNNHAHVNFKIILDLSALSWAIYDCRYELEESRKLFQEIIHQKKYSYIFNIFFVSFANAAFCKLFGGDFASAILVFFAALLGLILRYILTKVKIDLRIQYILCSFLSSLLVAIQSNVTSTADVALGSSVLYLLPGVFFINSIIDILKDYILMGLSRIISVSILVCCLSLGLSMTLAISHFEILQ
ncbi:threonine/serine exporter ThrE family protein [Campylobacter sp. MIT 21-1685]|uniref:threonine/serine exporter family protein n=1 Tax=unclassified Campylobacter TaxID=2593542 RepID=UPI00224B8719|nr:MULTISPECIES: threonine/serine exporter ThrE family protein [unclassified Campylobacter]MCX2683676.1 threonine/serine exporter ThrE family protein [Campylobacter sp. MIT 21-1684]MCX2751961.1 threonine/serine exporter ThrE family protein [Campylobacter sp. MIT 21-1682]MCX2808177.1 threonine/serine exporter ThrE family protein [Campylobacter sp. MIT 21-1685]